MNRRQQEGTDKMLTGASIMLIPQRFKSRVTRLVALLYRMKHLEFLQPPVVVVEEEEEEYSDHNALAECCAILMAMVNTILILAGLAKFAELLL
jgi:hypothetical protein